MRAPAAFLTPAAPHPAGPSPACGVSRTLCPAPLAARGSTIPTVCGPYGCRGPGTAFEFALALVRELYGEEKMREVAGPMVMAPGWDHSL